MLLRPRRLAAVLVLPVLLLSACGSGSGSDKAATSAAGASSSPKPGATTSTAVGVAVTGGFGQTPTLKIPASAAPSKLSKDVITAGTGATVAKGQTLVANYVGETWKPKDGKPNVFDSSFAKGAPVGFPIGTGSVIPGWDQTLVGQKVGSRVLLTIPPELGYGKDASAGNELAGQTLVFVVDVLGAIDPDAAASGTAVDVTTAGLPKITSVPGKKPTIASVAGVTEPKAPTSALLVKGDGAKIDPSKSLALQLVQTDIATGKATQETWGKGVQVVAAAQVLPVADALKDQNIGSRVVTVTPGQADSTGAAQPGVILVIDVVGQF